ncbi:MAG: glycosyltransferase family 2 protein [bacterium]|nr:glycosyltransferase family 2 protein [bacterium]
MRTSIAMATFNGSKYVCEQLESFGRQSRLPDEVVVSDDGSTDATLDIVREFAARSSFEIRVFTNEAMRGVVSNFQNAISHCTGELIFLSDQDDVWHERKIDTIVQEFDRDPSVGFLFSNAELVDNELNELGETIWNRRFSTAEQRDFNAGEIYKVIFERNVVTGATAAFRSNLRRWLLPMPNDFPFLHDAWIALACSALGNVAFVPEKLIKYRIHDGQTTRIPEAEDFGMEQESERVQLSALGSKLMKHRLLAGTLILDRLKEIEVAAGNDATYIARAIRDCQFELKKAREGLDHFELRRKLSPLRISRLIPVSRELITSRYGRFSNGMRSALKDLLSR